MLERGQRIPELGRGKFGRVRECRGLLTLRGLRRDHPGADTLMHLQGLMTHLITLEAYVTECDRTKTNLRNFAKKSVMVMLYRVHQICCRLEAQDNVLESERDRANRVEVVARRIAEEARVEVPKFSDRVKLLRTLTLCCFRRWAGSSPRLLKKEEEVNRAKAEAMEEFKSLEEMKSIKADEAVNIYYIMRQETKAKMPHFDFSILPEIDGYEPKDDGEEDKEEVG